MKEYSQKESTKYQIIGEHIHQVKKFIPTMCLSYCECGAWHGMVVGNDSHLDDGGWHETPPLEVNK